jgi:hypothetical protein
MQAYVCERLGENVGYLSPMRINERAIKDYDIPDNHDKIVHLLYTQVFKLLLMILVVLLRTMLTASMWRIQNASIKDPTTTRRYSPKHLKSGTTSMYVPKCYIRCVYSQYVATSDMIPCMMYIMQCSKPPHGLVLCGLYVFGYLRAFDKFSTNYK